MKTTVAHCRHIKQSDPWITVTEREMIIIGRENGMFIGCKSIGCVIENGINCRWRRWR